MAYATTSDVQSRMITTMSADKLTVCTSLLDDIAVLIDAYNSSASADAKKIVSCSAVMRALSAFDDSMPMGASQGSMSALGYSQTWTMPNGGTGELYLTKAERKILGVGNSIGSYSPVEELVVEVEE